jgi:Arc/MetJ-type ribon-helix-helix transcriptional regulator
LKSEEREVAKMDETLGVRVSSRYMKAINLLIKKGVYASKGEIVREGLRRIFLENGIKILEIEL